MFNMRCQENGIEHRLTRVKHPWTKGQIERMNRTLKEATVQRYHYDSHQQLEVHLADFVSAYNFGRRLKTLRGATSSCARPGQKSSNVSDSTCSTKCQD
jgi:transposase InsO family protein